MMTTSLKLLSLNTVRPCYPELAISCTDNSAINLVLMKCWTRLFEDGCLTTWRISAGRDIVFVFAGMAKQPNQPPQKYS